MPVTTGIESTFHTRWDSFYKEGEFLLGNILKLFFLDNNLLQGFSSVLIKSLPIILTVRCGENLVAKIVIKTNKENKSTFTE